MNQNIEMELHMFYGIHDGKLYVQFADRPCEIVYEAEVALPDTEPATILSLLDGMLAGPAFKTSDVKWARLLNADWDGQKIVTSGVEEFLDADFHHGMSKVEPLCPQFREALHAGVKANGFS